MYRSTIGFMNDTSADISKSPEIQEQVRHALDSLQSILEEEYACGGIWSEADVQSIVIHHLKLQLRAKDHRWIIGSNHAIGKTRPDVLCYYASGKYADFMTSDDVGLAALIEIKWASVLGNDLKKLAKVARKFRVLTWMVYGGHFDPSIHHRNSKRDGERESKIRKWTDKLGVLAGHTIIKCGEIRQHPIHQDRIDAIREYYWIRDAKNKARPQI